MNRLTQIRVSGSSHEKFDVWPRPYVRLNEFISSNTFYPSASDELLKIVSGTNVHLHMRRTEQIN